MSFHPRDLIDAYRRGENITSLLKKSLESAGNTEEIIETAYDLQAGSYVAGLSNPKALNHITAYSKTLVDEILSRTKPTSILEAGIGEGTTFSFVLKWLNDTNLQAHGFDLSWSRIAYCREWLKKERGQAPFLSVASLLHLPYEDNCFDIVYTSHAIEPNGGNEEQILKELYRVSSRYLILLEPSYELASAEAKQRMTTLGYVRDLEKHAARLNMQVIKHELFPNIVSPLNPTAITIIAKNPHAGAAMPALACPRFGDTLADQGDSLFSAGSLRAYPKIGGIPCLRPQDGIIASAYEKYGSL